VEQMKVSCETSGDQRPGGPDIAAVELSGVTLAYRGRTVLEDVDLTVEEGEIVAVVGPSGSGKSSLLRAIAGFLDPLAGSIRIDGELVSDVDRSVRPERRGLGYVFQQYALWPHMTARENVAYPWRARGVGAAERSRLADELLVQVGLGGFENRLPATLSGGQQQRVALARGLAGDPRLLLLDEPLSSIDAARRDELQTLIGGAVRSRRLTTLITTHDQREATSLADRVVVLGDGRIEQCGTPIELLERPANGFVARFMGALNVFEVRPIEFGDGVVTVSTIEDEAKLIVRSDEALRDAVTVLVARPESIHLVDEGMGDQDGTVLRSVLVDGRSEVRVELDGVTLRVFEPGVPRRTAGTRVGVVLENCLFLAPAPRTILA
jgi:iron(III) transport system ATP-binding protein